VAPRATCALGASASGRISARAAVGALGLSAAPSRATGARASGVISSCAASASASAAGARDGPTDALVRRAEAVDRLRERGDPTVPFSLAMEAATNPFVRAGSVAELARRRAAKDAFRG
jgi:hypothetical protein